MGIFSCHASLTPKSEMALHVMGGARDRQGIPHFIHNFLLRVLSLSHSNISLHPSAFTHYASQQFKMEFLKFILVLTLCSCGLWLREADGTLGVDMSTSTSKTAFLCLKNNIGYEFVIVRAYQSDGEPDRAASVTISNAEAAGFRHVDVYMFPCPRCSKSAREQVDEMGM